LHEANVQLLYDDFTKILTYLINFHIPTTQMPLRANSPLFETPLISQLLRRRNRFRRAGKLDKAGDISVKVGKLLADWRAQMLADLTDRDTRQLVAAVSTSRNRSQLLPTHIILILSTSVSPVSWKHSLITPILKVTPPRDNSDLRRISFTPILSLIYDKLFVVKFLLKAIPNNIFDDQFAFGPTGSTTAFLRCLTCFMRQLMLLNIAIILDVFLLTLLKLSIRYFTTNY
jgi:hypothetical protein